MKDKSLIVKTIRIGSKRIVVGEHEFNMKSQVIQTLREATLDRLGGSARAIFDMNKGLIHVLNLINQAPEGKISTRELLRSINSTSMHKYLKEAEELGFLKRYTERMPPGQKGGVMVMNSLTEEGRVLLKLHDELTSSSSSVHEGRRHR
jgi:DNA-binding HxlR family transcriptional regulator